MNQEPHPKYVELLANIRRASETAPTNAAQFPELLRNGLEAITATGPIPMERPMKLLFVPQQTVGRWMKGTNLPDDEMMRRTLSRVARMLAKRLGIS